MDNYKVGNLISQLRKEHNMTQKELADKMHLSDRTISKWERGAGCPDISLLPELSDILNINIEKILQGDLNANEWIGGNMKKIKFYVCPSCGNILYSTAEADISCCGRKITALAAVPAEGSHDAVISELDNHYYLTFNHEMTKRHYVSFAAYVTFDSVHLVKLYPEQNPELRFPLMRRGELYFYCSEHGLFHKKIK